jgi:DHA2 family multidrug resistance protein-like MFS transporter
MLRGIYPQRELSRGIGYNTMVVAVSLGIGPTVASLILSIASWPWLFAVNVPIGILTLIIAQRVLPSFPRSRHPFDLRSAMLSAATFALLVLSIDGLGHDQSSLFIAAEFTGFLLFSAILIRRQRSLASPLLPIDLLRIRLFSLSVGTTFMASMAQLMAYVAIPFLFHQLGRSQTSIGLLVTPWPVMVAIIAPFAGRLARRWSPGPLASAGLLVLAAGLVLVAILPAGAGIFNICWRMLLCGLGYGIFLPPNSATQISAVPKIRSGGASSMGATCRVLGQAIGAALVAGLFGLYPASGTSLALYAAAAIAGIGAIVSFCRIIQSKEERSSLSKGV